MTSDQLLEVTYQPALRAFTRHVNHQSSVDEIEHTVTYIPTELCVAVNVPQSTLTNHELIPSVLSQLEIALTVEEYRLQMQCSLPSSTIQDAFLSPNAKAERNYERFETLGDSYLKYAISRALYRLDSHLDEGSLSQLRAQRVSNV